ncbi:MAG: Gfo/Idh/MocA family oxidoreductase [Deltaproteobacteria bacterium]|nr:Gfo/Idh/MocA family oxidoreductase [Deltaproteobacteria bacterium]
MKSTKVMVFGLGYIGRMVLEAVLSENPFWNRRLELVGAVDIVPESREWAKKKGVAAFQSLDDLLAKARPDVCIHTTSSSMAVVVPQLKALVAAGVPVVSSTEELFYPWIQNPKVAEDIDGLCKKHGVAMMGTGVNPGFVMDVLPAIVTQAVHTVDFIRVERLVNAATRRPPLQKKIGAGLDETAFRAQVEKKKIGHVGLRESLDYLASFLGLTLTKSGESIVPIIAPKALATRVMTIKKGQVCGLHHQAWGEVDRKRVIELDLKISMNADVPCDTITIQGNPPITLSIEGGTPGDPATVAALVRGIPIVLQAKPGIVRRLDRDHFLS